MYELTLVLSTALVVGFISFGFGLSFTPETPEDIERMKKPQNRAT